MMKYKFLTALGLTGSLLLLKACNEDDVAVKPVAIKPVVVTPKPVQRGMFEQRDSVGVNNLAAYGEKLAGQVDSLIKARHIDPDNLVILMGEAQPEEEEQLVELSFMGAMQKKFGSILFFSEAYQKDQEQIAASGVAGDLNQTIQKLHANHFDPEMKDAYSLSLGMQFYGMDLEARDAGKASRLVEKVPQEYQEIYRNDPFFQELFDANPTLFTQTGFKSDTKEGALQRNFTMAARIDQQMKEMPGTAITWNNLSRLADPDLPDIPTIPEMLLHMKRNVMTLSINSKNGNINLEVSPKISSKISPAVDVQIGSDSLGIDKPQTSVTWAEAHRMMVKRLPSEQLAHYQANFEVVVPATQNLHKRKDNDPSYWNLLQEAQIGNKSGNLMLSPSESGQAPAKPGAPKI